MTENQQHHLDFSSSLASGDAEGLEQVLKEFPACANMQLGEFLPLHLAAINDFARVADRLIAFGANVDAGTPSKGETPLFWAAKMGHVASVKVLLMAGADPRKAAFNGLTPWGIRKQANGAQVQQLLDANVKEKQEREAAELRELIEKEMPDPSLSSGRRPTF